MSDMYPFYFLLGALLCFGAKSAGRGEWQEVRSCNSSLFREV